MGTPNAEEYCPAELRVNHLLFCAIDPPDPRYPFAPAGDPLDVSGADGMGDMSGSAALTARLPADVSLYTFFVVQWNSFIYIAGSDIQMSLSGPQAGRG
jgi:hypothetical protein